MLENIRIAARSIWSHKLRSLLTILGVIIGIASIIAIVSIVEGTSQKLEKGLIGAGNNVTTVSLSQQEGWTYDAGGGLPPGVPLLTEADLDRLRELDGVAAVTAYLSRQSWNSVFYQDRPLSYGTVYGISDSFFATMQYSLARGRDFTAEEYSGGRKVAILDTNAADAVFYGVDPVGEIIEIQQEPYLVVGVIRNDNAVEMEYESINDYYMYGYESSMGQVFVPQNSWPIIYQFDEPPAVGLRVYDTKDMVPVGKRACDLLNENVTNPDIRYASGNSQSLADDLKTLTNAIQMMLVAIASLSLLVGGIGVMNIMLVSVTERTAEIGLKKALGAKRRTILTQFLTESAVLTSVGGVLGVIVGIGLAKLISIITGLEFGISVPWILIAVGFSMAIGLIFGAMPASRAARLDPIEALRRE